MMVIHPDVQKEAQNEMDRVVGRGRLPSFSDRERLPYLEGVIKEIFRTCPVVALRESSPGALWIVNHQFDEFCIAPHLALQEDEYAGYRIPKGAVIMPNIWCVYKLLVSLKYSTDHH